MLYVEKSGSAPTVNVRGLYLKWGTTWKCYTPHRAYNTHWRLVLNFDIWVKMSNLSHTIHPQQYTVRITTPMGITKKIGQPCGDTYDKAPRIKCSCCSFPLLFLIFGENKEAATHTYLHARWGNYNIHIRWFFHQEQFVCDPGPLVSNSRQSWKVHLNCLVPVHVRVQACTHKYSHTTWQQ